MGVAQALTDPEERFLCGLQVGHFFVNVFMNSPKRYLNGQIWRLFVPNTLTVDQNKRDDEHPVTFIQESPGYSKW